MIKRPIDPNPLFRMSDDPVVAKSLSPLQRQREKDGTHGLRGNPTSLHPPDTELYLEGLTKSTEEPIEKSEPLDPDVVVKAFMAYTEGE